MRGNRLRYEGEYSDGTDYTIGHTLNSKGRMDENQHGDKSRKASAKLRGKTGLIVKEPLT
jgi:hypothetical protein